MSVLPNPLEGLERDLDGETVSPEIVVVLAPSGASEDDRELQLALHAGIFDLLTEAAVRSAGDDREGLVRLERASATVRSLEPVLRFALFEQQSGSERRDLVARMRGRDIALTERWMIPRLEEDIAAYRDRIDALRRALRELPS